MTMGRAARRSYRITGRSLRRALLFLMPACAALGLGIVALDAATGGPSRLSQGLLVVLGPAVTVPIATKLLLVPVDKPAKGPEDLPA